MGPVASCGRVPSLLLLAARVGRHGLARSLLAVPLAALWLGGPVVAWWVSQPDAPARGRAADRGRASASLRRVARKTWRFFETFVVEHGHYLAPDNFQEDPGGVVAWRTSPTNIGLQLLSYVTALRPGLPHASTA